MTSPQPNDARQESPLDMYNSVYERVEPNPLKMDHEALLRDVKHFAPMMRRRSTIPYDSVHAAFLAKLEQRRRRDRVRFSMPYCPTEETRTLQQEAQTQPPANKRRRYQRRNSKTAAMMFSTKQSSSSSLPSVAESEVSSSSGESSWENVADNGIAIAKNLMHAIEARQQRDESV